MIENLLPALGGTDSRVHIVCSRNEVLREEVASCYGARSAGDWRQVLDEQECDGLIVAATPRVHAEIAEIALERGIPLFIEKPPAPTKADLEKLCRRFPEIEATHSFVDMNYRFSTGFQRFVEATQECGGPVACHVRFVTSKPRSPKWDYSSVLPSLVYQIGIHAVDLAAALCPVTVVGSCGVCYGAFGTCQVQALLSSEQGHSSVVEFGNYSNRFECECSALCASGAFIRLSELSTIEITMPTTALKRESRVRRSSIGEGGYGRGGYTGALNSFIDMLRNGNKSTSPLSRSLRLYTLLEQLAAERDTEVGLSTG